MGTRDMPQPRRASCSGRSLVTPHPASAPARPRRSKARAAAPQQHQQHQQQEQQEQQEQEHAQQQAGRAAYPYNAGEGERRQKATIEHVFTAVDAASGSTGAPEASSSGRSAAAAAASRAQVRAAALHTLQQLSATCVAAAP